MFISENVLAGTMF